MIPDIAVANYKSDDIYILTGRGDGTFQTAGSLHIAEGPLSLGTGDFNDDHQVDLVCANYKSNNVSVFINQ